MEKPLIVAAFYKYVNLKKPELFRKEHLKLCDEIGLRGRILVAKEGINGSVSGTPEQIENYKEKMNEDSRFKGTTFKEDYCEMHPFKKMNIKVKPELVRFEQNVDLKNTGKHISPKEFIDLYENKEDCVILDARNNYESRVGKFKDAITPDINNFREFPKVIELIKDKKDKKIVMYCTGGIRCEKASAYLKENGFENVYQLDGGILGFAKEFPDSVWEGKCFVFDKRLLSPVNKEDLAITNCDICDVRCDLYKNCSNNDCDDFCVVCLECEKQYGGCCSKECFIDMQKETRAKSKLALASS